MSIYNVFDVSASALTVNRFWLEAIGKFKRLMADLTLDRFRYDSVMLTGC